MPGPPARYPLVTQDGLLQSALGNTALLPRPCLEYLRDSDMTMTSLSDPLVGHVLDGRYRITERLARGGMATVYRATDLRLTRTVAVKVMHAGLGDDAEFSRKFDAEARAAARLSHPNVVAVFDQGQDDLGRGEIRPYIVMEYVEGRTLRSVISREAPLEPLRALELIEPVLAALAAAHEAGLVHRDVKPENVLLSPRGQIKVADFGLAKAISAQTSTATQGLLIGTVSYLPPELVLSGRADARSDVYSAGIVLFELLTGRKPHTGDTPIQVAYAHVHEDVPLVSSMPTSAPIPPYLDALVSRVTARNADARPPDARVMLTQVRRVKAALRAGLADDPELTQDLTVPLRQLAQQPGSDELGGWSRADAMLAETQTRNTEITGLPVADPRRTDPRHTDPQITRVAVAPTPAGPLIDPSWASSPISASEQTGQITERSIPHDVRSLNTPSRPSRPDSATDAVDFHAERLISRDVNRDRRRRRRRFRGWLILLLVLLLTAVATYTGWYLTKGRFTSSPALTTLSEPQAKAAAQQAGFTIHFDDAFSEVVSSGAVISTDPNAGTKIERGAEIEAVVSKGPERHTTPTVVGRTQTLAQQAILAAQLSVGVISTSYSADVAKGTVISTSPTAGTQLKPQTAIALTVSSGPKPITITDYTGKSAKSADRALTKAGFNVTVTEQHSGSAASGSVISQSPKDGSGVKGDTITLVKSIGPVMVQVPNVRAMGVGAATSVLAKAGFTVSRHKASQNYLGLGYVAYAKPGIGSKAAQGSTIALYLV